MKIFFLYIICFLFLFISCNIKTGIIHLSYDLHENDSVFKNYIDIYIKPCKHNTAFRRITIYQNKEQIISFDEYITDKNIYRGINDTFFLNYSFVEKKLSNNYLTDNYSPFINSHILDFEKKTYSINKQDFQIISFLEYPIVRSYYNDKFWFFCYYYLIENPEKQYFLILSEYKGISIDLKTYNEFKKVFLSDSLFFEGNIDHSPPPPQY